MAVTKLFVGSSDGSKRQAKVLIEGLKSATVEFLPWWDAFPAGRTLLEQLDAVKSKVDGALILFSPDAPATMKSKSVAIPNLNTVFELGYFYSHFGKEKVAMVKYGEFFIPSNLNGYIYIPGSQFSERNKSAPVSKKTKQEFEKWLKEF